MLSDGLGRGQQNQSRSFFSVGSLAKEWPLGPPIFRGLYFGWYLVVCLYLNIGLRAPVSAHPLPAADG